MMTITKTSPVSGETNTRTLDVTEAQLQAWRNGALIQYAMPQLSADDREFLITGCTPGDWEALHGADPDFA